MPPAVLALMGSAHPMLLEADICFVPVLDSIPALGTGSLHQHHRRG